MPIPTTISDLSTSVALNPPDGADQLNTVDDHLRAHAAFIAQLWALVGSASGPLNSTAFGTGSLTYNGTLTGGTGVINIGAGQIYKDAAGSVGIGGGAPAAGYRLDVAGGQRLNAAAGGFLDLALGGALRGNLVAVSYGLLINSQTTTTAINPNGGNVSIGIGQDRGVTLHVNGTIGLPDAVNGISGIVGLGNPGDTFVVDTNKVINHYGLCWKNFTDGAGSAALSGYGGVRIYTGGAERIRVTGTGIGLWTSSPTARLDINDDTVRLRSARTPASATAAGNQGDICWDASYVYVCVAANLWRRSALSAW
jgi:hypothetical protein